MATVYSSKKVCVVSHLAASCSTSAPSPHPAQLLSLPLELLTQVCCWLDWPALLAARTTCSRLRQGVEHTAAWTHRRLVICNKVLVAAQEDPEAFSTLKHAREGPWNGSQEEFFQLLEGLTSLESLELSGQCQLSQMPDHLLSDLKLETLHINGANIEQIHLYRLLVGFNKSNRTLKKLFIDDYDMYEYSDAFAEIVKNLEHFEMELDITKMHEDLPQGEDEAEILKLLTTIELPDSHLKYARCFNLKNTTIEFFKGEELDVNISYSDMPFCETENDEFSDEAEEGGSVSALWFIFLLANNPRTNTKKNLRLEVDPGGCNCEICSHPTPFLVDLIKNILETSESIKKAEVSVWRP